jgi:hypothetical protein
MAKVPKVPGLLPRSALDAIPKSDGKLVGVGHKRIQFNIQLNEANPEEEESVRFFKEITSKGFKPRQAIPFMVQAYKTVYEGKTPVMIAKDLPVSKLNETVEELKSLMGELIGQVTYLTARIQELESAPVKRQTNKRVPAAKIETAYEPTLVNDFENQSGGEAEFDFDLR